MSDDLKSRLREMHRRAQAAEGKLDRMTRFVRIVVETMNSAPTKRDRMVLQSLKAALRFARAKSGSYSLAVWAWQTEESNKQKTRAEAAEAALTQSRAETAAAYERAANAIKPPDGPTYHLDLAHIRKQYSDAIRNLTTPEQSAALDAVKAEARAQGMREAAGIVWNAKDDIDLWSRNFIQNRILAAIQKGEPK